MFHSSKFYGQNFLINRGIIQKIIAAADLSKDDTILEVGSGTGALTEELIKYAGRVVAVEKDPRLFKFLKKKFEDVKNLELINADILKTQNAERRMQNYKIVANIPYNITGAFFEKFLLARHRPQMIVVMVQKEVGAKLLARKPRTILSLAAELYGRAKKICDVAPGSFNPPPKVKSAVIKLIRVEKVPLEEKILRLAKLGFKSKRKKLVSNLSTGLRLDKNYLKKIFSDLSFKETVRAQELSADDWLKLAKIL